MSLYHGNKSLDAEIFIDLKTGNITMDYTLNNVASRYSSNNSAVLKDEFGSLPARQRLAEVVKRLPATIFLIGYTGFTSAVVTFLLHRGILKSENYQVEHQKLMKRMFINNLYSYQEITEGPLETSTLKLWIPYNLWMHYDLEGEYQETVKSIELKRHFDTRRKFGIYEQVVQHGWDLVFTFDHPPQSGRCIVEHT